MAIKLLDISVLASAADDAERCELSEGRVGVGSPNLLPGSSAAGESSVVCDEPGAEHEQECTTRCCQLSQIAVGEYPDRPMLGAADKHFITRLRGTSPAIETPSAIQLSPPMPPLVLHALKRVRLRLAIGRLEDDMQAGKQIGPFILRGQWPRDNIACSVVAFAPNLLSGRRRPSRRWAPPPPRRWRASSQHSSSYTYSHCNRGAARPAWRRQPVMAIAPSDLRGPAAQVPGVNGKSLYI